MNGVKEVFKRFSPYIKDYIPQFTLAIIGMLMAAGGTSATAWLIEPVLNKIFINKDETLLYILPYAIIAIYAIKSGGTYMQRYFTVYIGQDIIRQFREKMVKNLINLDMKFFNEFRTGELISRTVNDIDRIRNIVSNMIPEFFTNLIQIFGLLCVVIYQSPKLSLFALVVLPAAIYPLSILAKKMKKISKNAQEKTSDITSALSEIYTNIEIIKANNAENKEINRFKIENDKFFRLNLKSVKTGELVSPIMETLGAIGIATVIMIGGKEVIDNEITVGSFFSFLTALFMLYTPVKKISSLYNSMQDAVAASERTFELIDKVASIVGGNEEFPKAVKSIHFQDVWLKYDDKEVLKGINLSAYRGEMIALVGNSGGGKTSLINSLMRFYDISSGNILVNNSDLYDFSLQSVRENIGLVSQRVYIFNDTVANNVAYSGEFDEEKVIKALKMANAYEFVSKLENGINTVLSEFGSNLSGGQRQRIAIARMLYKNPQIIILDEATSALDNTSENAITEVIENLRKDKIIFVVAHRLSTVKNATNIAVINNGKVIGFGDDATLSSQCEAYMKLKGTFELNS
ncbi:ABC transporter ATP-binding protein [Campylobacter geochelonis]|uniref:Multidrug resistance-like ATP-binding protein MdlB n=1 Tax=Campylobacter geochelonis TaxID=1780362 RepID=A0A128EPU9_9BACT|nr:ABC transporter ATP-binding protein [Campylobacter geochelonis]QKF71330.1 lipid A export ATP-binding/permease protein [Campylobacter geochelonis]CZE48028.1 lipid export ABC transport protein [Campylobacter geochelonis]CZE48220.1 lipid export ABC transport protein [Campylobacter geochelonis]CZE51052.1 lipid export ABC transport protein [Campylobacter geochelonis]